jgi:hypothetical protein
LKHQAFGLNAEERIMRLEQAIRSAAATAIFAAAAAGAALAAIPEPDYILHGKVRINGVQAQPADDIRVLARVTVPRGSPPVPTEQIVGSYRIGDNPSAGNRYVLRMRLENLVADGTTVQSTNAAVAGQTASLYVRRGPGGADVFAGTTILSTPGTIQSRDLSVEVCGIVSSSPANCSIDARQPTNPDGNNPAGLQSVVLTFNCSPVGLAPSDFAITVSPPIGPPLSVGSVQFNNPVATLQLAGNNRMQPGAWTCFQHTANGTRSCIGFLPGDVNGDGTVSALDLVTLVDARNNVVSLPLSQTDIDRTGALNSADLSRVLDLLLGNLSYDAWYGHGIGECPSPP